MHAPAAFEIKVRSFTLWRAGLGLLAGSAFVVVMAWWPASMRVNPTWTFVTVAVLVGSVLAVLANVRRMGTFCLRWDTQIWRLTHSGMAGHEAHAGQVYVALDLGRWMLLRFVQERAPFWNRDTWLPVQRRGHELEWHSLRCTVYCAQPEMTVFDT